MNRLSSIAVLICTLAACRAHDQPSFVRTEDGQVFPVLFLGRVILGGTLAHAPVLRLEYRTKLRTDDSAQLRAEALAVFRAWQAQLDKDGYRYAVLSAASEADATGSRHLYTYVFERDVGGPWHGKLLGNERPDRG